MQKVSENSEVVSYKFDMQVIDKKHYRPGEEFAYKVDTHIAYGYGTFNKKTEEFIIDESETDPYFLEHKNYAGLVWMKLLQFNRTGEFPPIACFAS